MTSASGCRSGVERTGVLFFRSTSRGDTKSESQLNCKCHNPITLENWESDYPFTAATIGGSILRLHRWTDADVIGGGLIEHKRTMLRHLIFMRISCDFLLVLDNSLSFLFVSADLL